MLDPHTHTQPYLHCKQGWHLYKETIKNIDTIYQTSGEISNLMSRKGDHKPQFNNSVQKEPCYEAGVCAGAASKVIPL